MVEFPRSPWSRARDAACALLAVVPLLLMFAVGLAGCAVQDPQGGDNAPDPEWAPPDAADVSDKAWWRLPPLCQILPSACPDAGVPDARPPDAAPQPQLPTYWWEVANHDCTNICNRFEEYAARDPAYRWCAPTWTACYSQCMHDATHVPAVCWYDFHNWLRDEWWEGPDVCAHPSAHSPPYAYWAEYARNAYRVCWDRHAGETR